MHLGCAIRSVRPWFGGRAQTHASSPPSVGLFRNDAGWFVRDSNTHAPVGYAVTTDAGTTFAIDPNGHPGLTIQITSARPEVVYP